MMRISESEALFNGIIMTNLTCKNELNEALQLTNSFIKILDLNYTSSTCRLIQAAASQLNLEKLSSSQISLNKTNLINIQRSKATDTSNRGVNFDTLIESCIFKSISSNFTNLIFIKNSEISKIGNTAFTEIGTQVINIEHSVVNLMNNVHFESNLQ